MDVLGVICEYNPFHKGHAYMLSEIGSYRLSDRAVVCAMSGNFVQRGEAAVMNKYARAEAAVKCGADMVIELPLPWAMSSAESFAEGGVSLLAATGIVSHIGFGSECGDIALLERTAETLLMPELDGLIKQQLDKGLSYASAREAALRTLSADCADILKSPNNILAVEYLKAIYKNNFSIKPVTVPRRGAAHDERGEGELLSASELRARLAAGEEISSFVPDKSARVIKREIEAGCCPVTGDKLETAVLSRLRVLPISAFEALPDASEGLERRLYEAVHSCPDIGSILEYTKSKRYAMSRIRRMLMGAALGIDKNATQGGIPYIKILALSETGKALAKSMKEKAKLPVITKPSQIRSLSKSAQRLFALESAADDLYCLGYDSKSRRLPGSAWRNSPFVEKL